MGFFTRKTPQEQADDAQRTHTRTKDACDAKEREIADLRVFVEDAVQRVNSVLPYEEDKALRNDIDDARKKKLPTAEAELVKLKAAVDVAHAEFQKAAEDLNTEKHTLAAAKAKEFEKEFMDGGYSLREAYYAMRDHHAYCVENFPEHQVLPDGRVLQKLAGAMNLHVWAAEIFERGGSFQSLLRHVAEIKPSLLPPTDPERIRAEEMEINRQRMQAMNPPATQKIVS